MKVVTAIDSLKGSLTSLEAGMAIKQGILRAIPDAEVTVHPLADGGEGTVETLEEAMSRDVAEKNMIAAVEQASRLIHACGKA